MRYPKLVWATSVYALIGLAACGAPKQPDVAEGRNDAAAPMVASPEAEEAPQTANAMNVATAASAPQRLSCAADIGSAAAAERVKLCRNVSPATHPPCNAANSCALIEDEIARSCALFDGKGDPMPGCDPAPKSTAAARRL